MTAPAGYAGTYEVVGMFATDGGSGSGDGGAGPGGSLLGVVPDAAGLSTDRMLAVAQDLGVPETAFVVPPSVPGATYRSRVFTPEGESPFGSHSALGTAVTLVRRGLAGGPAVVQECGPRLLTVDVDSDGDEGTIVVDGAPLGEADDAELLAAAAGVAADDVVALPARTAGFGPAFHYLPVRSPATVRSAAADLALMEKGALTDVLVFSWDAAERRACTRLFAPGYGMPEDPACAPVALGLGAWLVHAGWLPATGGTHRYELRQGGGTAREGLLHGTVVVGGGGTVRGGSVRGRVVPVERSSWGT